MKKILVLRGGALGDFIVTLPALSALRLRWPEARIELAGNATAAQLGLREGLLDAAHSQHEGRWSAFFSREPLPPAFADWLATFDLVLSFWPDPDSDLTRYFPRHPAQLFLTASALPTRNPAAAHYLSALAPLGIYSGALWYRLRLTETISPVPGRIAIHPGSGSLLKNWPIDRWAALCAWLRETWQLELFIVTGEAESHATLETYGAAWHQLPLLDLAVRLASCELFLGHDSGISHLAAAANVSCLLLFGPTDPVCWAPPSLRVKIMREGPALAAISVEAVRSVLRIMLEDRSKSARASPPR